MPSAQPAVETPAVSAAVASSSRAAGGVRPKTGRNAAATATCCRLPAPASTPRPGAPTAASSSSAARRRSATPTTIGTRPQAVQGSTVGLRVSPTSLPGCSAGTSTHGANASAIVAWACRPPCGGLNTKDTKDTNAKISKEQIQPFVFLVASVLSLIGGARAASPIGERTHRCSTSRFVRCTPRPERLHFLLTASRGQ